MGSWCHCRSHVQLGCRFHVDWGHWIWLDVALEWVQYRREPGGGKASGIVNGWGLMRLGQPRQCGLRELLGLRWKVAKTKIDTFVQHYNL